MTSPFIADSIPWLYPQYPTDDRGESRERHIAIDFVPGNPWLVCRRSRNPNDPANVELDRRFGGRCKTDTKLGLPCDGQWRELSFGPAMVMNSNVGYPAINQEGLRGVGDYRDVRDVATRDPWKELKCNGASFLQSALGGARGNTASSGATRAPHIRAMIRNVDGDLENRMYAWAGDKDAPNVTSQFRRWQNVESAERLDRAYRLPLEQRVHCLDNACSLEQMDETSAATDAKNHPGGWNLSQNGVFSPSVGGHRMATGAVAVIVCIKAKFRCVRAPDEESPAPDPQKIPIPSSSPIFFSSKLDEKYASHEDYLKAVADCRESVASWIAPTARVAPFGRPAALTIDRSVRRVARSVADSDALWGVTDSWGFPLPRGKAERVFARWEDTKDGLDHERGGDCACSGATGCACEKTQRRRRGPEGDAQRRDDVVFWHSRGSHQLDHLDTFWRAAIRFSALVAAREASAHAGGAKAAYDGPDEGSRSPG